MKKTLKKISYILLVICMLIVPTGCDDEYALNEKTFEEYLEAAKKTIALKDYTVTTSRYYYDGFQENVEEYITMATDDKTETYNKKYYRYEKDNILTVQEEKYSYSDYTYNVCQRNKENINCSDVLNNTNSIDEINNIKNADYLGFLDSSNIDIIGKYFEEWFYNFDYNNRYFESREQKKYTYELLEDNWFSKDEYLLKINFRCKYYDYGVLKDSTMTVNITFKKYIKNVNVTIKNTWDNNESIVKFKMKISTKYNNALEK